MGKYSTSHEFASACADHGFVKHGKVFSRCIGDAIYQNISIASSEYIEPTSSKYSLASQKAPVVKIGIWSMYSDLPSFYFSDRRYIGDFYPENLLGFRFGASTFMDFQNEYEIMLNTGFSLLDSITTQKELISQIYALQQVQYGGKLPHRLELCAPHLLCGEYDKALSILYGIYAQNWLNFHTKNDHLKESGQYEAYINLEMIFEKDMNNITAFLRKVLGRRSTELKENILSSLERNLQLAKENQIIFASNFYPLYKD